MSTGEKKEETKPAFVAPGAPEPKSKLGYYRLLSPSCGLRVSPICLGTMSFGTAWKKFMGDMTKEIAFQILDYYYEQGGNFIDTAAAYQDEENEIWLGEWFEKTGRRDEFVLATKYSGSYKMRAFPNPGEVYIQVNYTGNARKNMFMTLEASLQKLKTSYIDLYYVHFWDHTTPIEEMMQGLNALVLSGKVHYLGISNTPAWVVSKANQYARSLGMAQFVVYQGRWSLAHRDIETDIVPMCKAEGMGLVAWNVLGGGGFKTDEEQAKAKENGEDTRTATRDPKEYKAVVTVMQALAERKQTKVAGIALAYVLAKDPYVFPVLGIRKIEHLKGNIDALATISLSADEIKELEAANPLKLGYPHNLIGLSAATAPALARIAKYSWVEDPKLGHSK